MLLTKYRSEVKKLGIMNAGTVKKLKIDLRGTTKSRRVLDYGPSLLLDFIWKKHGGNLVAGKMLGISSQSLINWRAMGYVPLEKTGPLSRKLNVPPEALNYIQTIVFNGGGLTWVQTVENVLKSLKSFGNVELLKKLKEKPPPSINDILNNRDYWCYQGRK